MKEPLYNQLVRQFAGPIDSRSVFETKADFNNYITKTKSTIYSGMPCYIVETDEYLIIKKNEEEVFTEELIFKSDVEAYFDMIDAEMKELKEQINKLTPIKSVIEPEVDIEPDEIQPFDILAGMELDEEDLIEFNNILEEE